MYPCVTAIINTYNRPNFLDKAIHSVFTQTFRDFETIIVHDGPADDETVAVVERWSTIFDKANMVLSFLSLEENSGYQCAPKNCATNYANGDYIAYLDDDNEWTTNHLEVLVDEIEAGHDWPDFVYGRREYIDLRHDTTQELYTGISPLVQFDSVARQRLADGPKFNFIDTSDALIAKGALWRLHMATGKMWNENMRRFGDWEMFTRGVHLSGWRGRAVDHVVQRYYWHGTNLQLTRPAQETPAQKAI